MTKVPLPEPLSDMYALDITSGDTPSLRKTQRVIIKGQEVVSIKACKAYADAHVREALEEAILLVQLELLPSTTVAKLRELMP